jgi:hypothetical protein
MHFVMMAIDFVNKLPIMVVMTRFADAIGADL